MLLETGINYCISHSQIVSSLANHLKLESGSLVAGFSQVWVDLINPPRHLEFRLSNTLAFRCISLILRATLSTPLDTCLSPLLRIRNTFLLPMGISNMATREQSKNVASNQYIP